MSPLVSVIVVFHNMGREAPRTLFTLSPQYQRGVEAGDYGVVVLDAGSHTPLEETFVKSFGENFRLVRSPAAPSPVPDRCTPRTNNITGLSVFRRLIRDRQEGSRFEVYQI